MTKVINYAIACDWLSETNSRKKAYLISLQNAKFTTIAGYTLRGPTDIESVKIILGQCINVWNYNMGYCVAVDPLRHPKWILLKIQIYRENVEIENSFLRVVINDNKINNNHRKYEQILARDIICLKERTVFLEQSSRKTVNFEEQIMFRDKYPFILFSHTFYGSS